MFTSPQFYQLSYAEQANRLGAQGTFLQTRTEGLFIIDLYELQDLLVEVVFDKESEEPVSVFAYDTRERLKTLGRGNLQPRLSFRKATRAYTRSGYAA